MSQKVEKNIPKLVVRKVVQARIDRVFEAWINPDMMSKWYFCHPDWTARCTSDPRVGGKYEVEMFTSEKSREKYEGKDVGESVLHYGEYLEISRPARLVFTWSSPFVENTIVTVELKDLGDETEIWLTHELLETEADRDAHEGGWKGVMDSISNFFNAAS